MYLAVVLRSSLLTVLFAVITPYIQNKIEILVAFNSPAFAVVRIFEIRTKELIMGVLNTQYFFTSLLIALLISAPLGALVHGKRFLFTTLYLFLVVLTYLGYLALYGEDISFFIYLVTTWSMISFAICCYPAAYIGGLLREKYVSK